MYEGAATVLGVAPNAATPPKCERAFETVQLYLANNATSLSAKEPWLFLNFWRRIQCSICPKRRVLIDMWLMEVDDLCSSWCGGLCGASLLWYQAKVL
jgi:hypothetical protein